MPSTLPSEIPSVIPSAVPSVIPSVTPSVVPSVTPSAVPSVEPSVAPSVIPSAVPSVIPSVTPSVVPSVTPSAVPSVEPSVAPSVIPSAVPSVIPSVTPSVVPSVTPSVVPSVTPSVVPSVEPSVAPSVIPSVTPSVVPSVTPSVVPSVEPSVAPSVIPSAVPSVIPSVTPSVVPSVSPSVVPSVTPSVSEEEKLAGIIFESKTFTYDGTSHSLTWENIPKGYNVRCVGNSLKNAGEKVITLSVYRGNTKVKTLTATITVLPATFEGVTFPSLSIPFDGKTHGVYLTGVAPYSFAKITYTDNRMTEPGVYTATAEISASNYTTQTFTTTLEITPLVFENITLTGVETVYNGNEHSAVVTGLESYPEAAVTFDNASRVNAGEQTATLTLTQRGYQNLTLTATVLVKPAPLANRVQFVDTVFVYNGSEQTLLAKWLPAEVHPVYENNSVTEVGESKTATLTVSDPNYEPLTLTALISVKKPEAVVKGLNVTKRMFVNDPSFYASITYSDTSLTERLATGETSERLSGTLSFEKVEVTQGGLFDLIPYGFTSEVYDIIYENGTVTVSTLNTNLVAGGAKAGPNGTMLYNGKEVHTFGVNFYSLFPNSLAGRRPFYEMEAGLAALKEAGVRVIRFNANVFYANEATKYFFGQEDVYWSVMDSVFHACAQNDILAIPSFYWAFWQDDYFGETYDQVFEDPATNTSQAFQCMMDYARTMVSRYQHHPAVLAWEFGNEWNLNNDLPNWKDWMPCKQTIEKHTKIIEYWANLVDEEDEYDRIITTGDSVLRGSQYHQYHQNSWGQDSLAQNMQMLALHNPGKISAVSAHVYGGYADGSMVDPTLLSTANYLTDLPAKTWVDMFSYLMDASKSLSTSMNKNVTTYVGECGIGHGSDFKPGDTKQSRLRKQKAVALEIGSAMLSTGMPVALIWNYDPAVTDLFEGDYADITSSMDANYYNQRSNGIEWSWNDKFEKGKVFFEAIGEINAQLEEKYGKF
ncbi:MAG: hypothetical protein E7363_02755 [Clostridiales bacterium]|nr:hypothetical protein [Clostridiales bacterium]